VTRRPRKLPLDDPRWIPIAAAHRYRRQQTGDRELAARDVTEAMADGRLPCMRRRIGTNPGPDRELVPRDFWNVWELQSWSDALLVARRGPGGVRRLRGYAFFVWEPRLKEIWPADSERSADDWRLPPPRRRGPATTHDWFAICAEIARRCIDPKTGRVRVPKSERRLARAMLDFRETAESEMRVAVKAVCAALRTVQK
jgi:hypothetical protein